MNNFEILLKFCWDFRASLGHLVLLFMTKILFHNKPQRKPPIVSIIVIKSANYCLKDCTCGNWSSSYNINYITRSENVFNLAYDDGEMGEEIDN